MAEHGKLRPNAALTEQSVGTTGSVATLAVGTRLTSWVR